jgi:hypothetical protein
MDQVICACAIIFLFFSVSCLLFGWLLLFSCLVLHCARAQGTITAGNYDIAVGTLAQPVVKAWAAAARHNRCGCQRQMQSESNLLGSDCAAMLLCKSRGREVNPDNLHSSGSVHAQPMELAVACMSMVDDSLARTALVCLGNVDSRLKVT